MDWDHLKAVLAIDRGGSLTNAAHELGLDQTTIGRRLNTIEAQLGCRLFLRVKGGFVATEEGRIVLENARAVEARLGAMRDDLVASRSGPSGLVRLMGNAWMLTRLAADFLPGLLERNSGLDIHLSGRLPPAPLHGDPTVSLWFDATPHHPDRATPFCRVPYATYRSARHDTDPDHWVQFHDDDAQGPSFLRQILKRLGPAARIRMTATDAAILAAAVRAGLGHGVLPVCLGDADPELVRTGHGVPGIDRILHLHVNPDAAKLKRVRLLVEELEMRLPDLLAGELLPVKSRPRRRTPVS